MDYRAFFRRATRSDPYPYQERLATATSPHTLLHIPTGLGKTAAVVLAWLWRRLFAGEEIRRQTPRRLVYCLPMRVLVEQTRDNIVRWLDRCDLLGGRVEFDSENEHLRSYGPDFSDPERLTVHVLMGGEDDGDWDRYPEREMILVGTQDMLLSRALNRGYGTSRYRWPMQFGLLHTDCLWIFDEIQLMGAGLATTAQLEAFRSLLPRDGVVSARIGHECRGLWMSATLQRSWLETVDFKHRVSDLQLVRLTEEDYKQTEVQQCWLASKLLQRAHATMSDTSALAMEVLDAHRPGTRTIVVVNTVRRARDLFAELGKLLYNADRGGRGRRKRAARQVIELRKNVSALHLVLLHSRLRPPERMRQLRAALAEIGAGDAGTIVVSTQVIEAGVDVSATTLFTELAPWASLVQRFGRCNRKGNENDRATVRWINLPSEGAAKFTEPYDLEDLRQSACILRGLKDAGPRSLSLRTVPLPFKYKHVIRRKDLVELFDTTPDLAGNDLDIDRFVREVEETDVRVFWRHWDGDFPPKDEPVPSRDELCPVPVGELRDFMKDRAANGKVFRRDFLEARWVRPETGAVYPGQTFLVHWKAGGYTVEAGWDARAHGPVGPPCDRHAGLTTEQEWEQYEREIRRFVPDPDDYDDDGLSRTDHWQTIAEHTDAVCAELDLIIVRLGIDAPVAECLRQAARWHDWGKAHEIFQHAIADDGRPGSWAGCRVVAKAPGVRRDQQGRIVEQGFWRAYERRHFRHELASALGLLHLDALWTVGADRALLAYFKSAGLVVEDADATWQVARDLIAYLVAAHHGKVRLLIRSFPNETRPRRDEDSGPDRRFARGVWDGDVLPQTDLGGGVIAPEIRLSLELMELGLCELPPFAGQLSWLERTLRLRDTLGPFRLAFLEALLRAADMRASAAATGVVHAIRADSGLAGRENRDA